MSSSESTSAASTVMVVRDGRRLAFHVMPGASPDIVLDAGGGLGASYYDALLPEIARLTGARVITYDRPGFGLSDPVPGPWNVASAAEDLAAGLASLGATQNVLLVAHSLAGEIALHLAGKHPEWLSGVVLVDANVPEFYTPEAVAATTAAFAPAFEAARTGVSTPESRQLLAVGQSFAEGSKAFHEARWPASTPILNIVSQSSPFEEASLAAMWAEAQATFGRAAPNRRRVVAAGSSHDVVHDRPDVILAAIVEMRGARST